MGGPARGIECVCRLRAAFFLPRRWLAPVDRPGRCCGAGQGARFVAPSSISRAKSSADGARSSGVRAFCSADAAAGSAVRVTSLIDAAPGSVAQAQSFNRRAFRLIGRESRSVPAAKSLAGRVACSAARAFRSIGPGLDPSLVSFP